MLTGRFAAEEALLSLAASLEDVGFARPLAAGPLG